MSPSSTRTAVIVGAGPAGLTAALELLRRTDVRPIVLEASNEIGGLSRTVNCNGYRMDIGGHRFFSKSDWVMQWWQDILPLDPGAGDAGASFSIAYRNKRRNVIMPARATDVEDDADRVMLVRNRLSRIYFLRKFFDYPISLNFRTFANLGPWRVAKAAAAYARASMTQRPERTLEDFLINRFGLELYRTFFKSYTEKVWGVPCNAISADWGAQRIRGLSLRKAILHALRSTARAPRRSRAAPTSLIERFLYPRLGPGQLWEEVARRIAAAGGEIRFDATVEGVRVEGARVRSVVARDRAGATSTVAADFVLSTMPVKDLVLAMGPVVPEPVRRVASRLPYRSFITVGVRARSMHPRFRHGHDAGPTRLPDNWIYVQEPEVRLGRVQIFNNWSPDLVPDADKVWLGLEYFCDEGDALWSLDDAEMQALAVRELEAIELVAAADVEGANVVRVPKAYPAYFGAYAEFDTIRRYVDGIENLFLIGRNGMHKYNNQDHSMLTARVAVDNIAAGRTDKDALWSINVDDDYHEEQAEDEADT